MLNSVALLSTVKFSLPDYEFLFMQLPDVLPGDPRRDDEDDAKTRRGAGGTQVKQEPPNPQVGVFSLS